MNTNVKDKVWLVISTLTYQIALHFHAQISIGLGIKKKKNVKNDIDTMEELLVYVSPNTPVK